MKVVVLCTFEDGTPVAACMDATPKMINAARKASFDDHRLQGAEGYVGRPRLDGELLTVPWVVGDMLQPVPWATYSIARFEVEL